jgi:phosphatidylglycerophosphatase A
MSTLAVDKAARHRLQKALWQDPWVFIACGFGAGSLPIMPGTYGSLVALLLYYMVVPYSLWVYVLFCVVLTIIAMCLCQYVVNQFALSDPGEACIDEFPGMLVTLIAVPAHWHLVLIGFFLFRFFDVLKPWPIGWLDKNIHGGFGMVLDDVAAGAAACVVLHILMIWIT